MAEHPIKWPNNARVAFVARHRTRSMGSDQADPGSRPAIAAPQRRALQMGLVHGNFSRLWPEDRHEASPRYLRQVQSQSQYSIERSYLRLLPGPGQDCHARGHEIGCSWLGNGRTPLYMLTREQERENILQDYRCDRESHRRTSHRLVIARCAPDGQHGESSWWKPASEYHCDFHDDEMPYPIWGGR